VETLFEGVDDAGADDRFGVLAGPENCDEEDAEDDAGDDAGDGEGAGDLWVTARRSGAGLVVGRHVCRSRDKSQKQIPFWNDNKKATQR